MRRVITAICPQCSARLPLAPGIREVVCQYCGTKVLLEKHAPTARPNVVAEVVEQTAAQKRRAQFFAGAAVLAIGAVFVFSWLHSRSERAGAAMQAEMEAKEYGVALQGEITAALEGQLQGMTVSISSSAPTPKGPDALLATKLSTLIFCLNDRAESSRMRYLQWVDAKKGPTGRERNIYGTYSLSLPKGCRSVLQNASQVLPALPALDDAAKNYADAMSTLVPLVEKAHNYYELEDYKDDAMSLGKGLHPKLMSGFSLWEEKFEAFLLQLNLSNDVHLSKELGGESCGEPAKVLVLARDLVRVASAMNPAKISTLDLTAFSSLLDQYVETVARLHETSRPDSDFLKHSKGLRRMAEAGQEFGRRRKLGTSSGWMTDDSPDRLRKEFGSMVTFFHTCLGRNRIVDMSTALGARIDARSFSMAP